MSQHFIDFWIWSWRRIHALGDCRMPPWGERFEAWGMDVGYCLDRYSIEDGDGNVTTSRP